MSQYVFKLPDLGEGTVEAEIVGWKVKPGDVVAEDDVIVEVMTEKAAVEVPSPVAGRVVSTTGEPGDTVPVGSPLIVFETSTGGVQASCPTQAVSAVASPANGVSSHASSGNGSASPGSAAANGSRVATSPAIRRRAHEAGVDLRLVPGSGPSGRIMRQDFDAYVAAHSTASAHPMSQTSASTARAVGTSTANSSMANRLVMRAPAPPGGTEEIKVIGLRRLIAQRMSESKRNIPHFAYVEELDVTELESLREHLNGQRAEGVPSLTYLPFLALGLVRVLSAFPQCNALYDSERGVIIRHSSVHLGVATQTPDGLKVPVVRDAQALSLWELSAEMKRVSEAARTNKATKEELSGSTITVTSLGKLGGIASTPIINAPEVSIIGVNRAVERPVVFGGAITIRRMMNLSSSFDHRFVDGFDAAAMIQALKALLEHPATLFMPN